MDQAINPATLRRRRRASLLAGAAALATLCAAAWGINRVASPSADAASLQLSAVRRGAIANTINASGVMVPLHEELVSSPVQTHVAKVHAKPGQQVAAGLLRQVEDNGHRLRQRDRLAARPVWIEQGRRLGEGVQRPKRRGLVLTGHEVDERDAVRQPRLLQGDMHLLAVGGRN